MDAFVTIIQSILDIGMIVSWGFKSKIMAICCYLLTKSEVFTRKCQTKTLPYGLSNSKASFFLSLGLIFFLFVPDYWEPGTWKAKVCNFSIKMKCSMFISCLLYGFILCLCRPVIGLWALWQSNVFKVANQSMHYIGYKQKPYNKLD